MTTCWPSGPPAIGATAELSRTIALDGTAVCYTMTMDS